MLVDLHPTLQGPESLPWSENTKSYTSEFAFKWSSLIGLEDIEIPPPTVFKK